LGRKVYGGGGITPDITVEPREVAPFLQHLLSRNVFFDFAVSYVNRNPIETRDWEPSDEIIGALNDWLQEERDVRGEEFEEQMQDPEIRETVQRYLHAELFNAAFGIEARYEIIAAGDPQVIKALSLFEEASDLLARRQRLLSGEESSPSRTASVLD
jgi:carboxyl-terminal processing protease